MLWTDQNDEKKNFFFFLNVRSCVLQITYRLRIRSTDSKSSIIPESKKEKKKTQKNRPKKNTEMEPIVL